MGRHKTTQKNSTQTDVNRDENIQDDMENLIPVYHAYFQQGVYHHGFTDQFYNDKMHAGELTADLDRQHLVWRENGEVVMIPMANVKSCSPKE